MYKLILDVTEYTERPEYSVSVYMNGVCIYSTPYYFRKSYAYSRAGEYIAEMYR